MTISRRTLIERVDRFVRAIENGQREPDRWEGLCAMQALAELGAGRVERAEANMILAKTPPVLRVSRDPPDVPADRREPTAAELRAEIERLKSEAN
jgi:hypothetical protein